MIRRNNYITILLVLIVLMLLVGVFVAIYYVLDLKWFESKPINIYNELPKVDTIVKKEIKYDIEKREYNLLLETQGLKVVVYKDGTVGITMNKNDANEQVSVYKEILNKEVKLPLKNIIRAYETTVSNELASSTNILLLDADGNLYKLIKHDLSIKGIYAFVKIEGLAKIIDIRQITSDNLTQNITGINAIAIDENSNELLLTEYLLQ